jgi:hypothetical protein
MNPLDRAFVFPALRGSWSLLAHHIIQGGELTPAMRLLLADIIVGNRDLQLPLGEKRFWKNHEVGDVISLENEGVRTTEAIEIVARDHDVDPRTIFRALREGRSRFEARVKFFRELRAKKKETGY